MDRKTLWNIAKIAFKLGFTILLVYLVFRKIDFQQVKSIFLKSDPWYILAALLTYFFSQVISSWRLLSFLRSIGLPLKFSFNFRLYLLGMFYNVFLPGGVGGDGYKIYLLRKKFQKPTRKIFFSLFFDRLSGLWAIATLSVALIILIPRIDIPRAWPLAALIAGSAVYYFIMRRFFADYMRYFAEAHLKAVLVQSLQLLSVVLILLSQDFDGKFSPYLFSFLVSSLATILPLSIGGFGIREYVMTHASTVFDMNQALAVYTTITFYILSTIAALPGIWFVYRSKEFDPMPDEKEASAVENDVDDVIESHHTTP